MQHLEIEKLEFEHIGLIKREDVLKGFKGGGWVM
jgi:hypothetical protein